MLLYYSRRAVERMKKAVVGSVLAGLLLRLAVLAGAGDTLAAWVRQVEDSHPVSSALEWAQRIEETPVPETTVVETPVPEPRGIPQYFKVSPEPKPDVPEEAVSEGERAPAQPVAADLSSDTRLNNRTTIDLDLDALAAEGLELRLDRDRPQVLIFHTHSSEAYTPEGEDAYEPSDPYRTEDRSKSVIRVGDELAAQLEAYGLTVLHDREIYDYPSDTGSYSRSGAAVERYLAENPGIRLVIDLHRDALGDGEVVYKTRVELEGETCAQVMLLVGTGDNGLWHPNWRDNLKCALYLQNAMDERYTGLARPIELVPERYNQQLNTGMLILEVGSTGNTLREAIAAVRHFGDAVGPALAARLE